VGSLTLLIDGLTKQSLFYCHQSVIIHLKLLFGMMMLHGFVPDDFVSFYLLLRTSLVMRELVAIMDL